MQRLQVLPCLFSKQRAQSHRERRKRGNQGGKLEPKKGKKNNLKKRGWGIAGKTHQKCEAALPSPCSWWDWRSYWTPPPSPPRRGSAAQTACGRTRCLWAASWCARRGSSEQTACPGNDGTPFNSSSTDHNTDLRGAQRREGQTKTAKDVLRICQTNRDLQAQQWTPLRRKCAAGFPPGLRWSGRTSWRPGPRTWWSRSRRVWRRSRPAGRGMALGVS